MAIPKHFFKTLGLTAIGGLFLWGIKASKDFLASLTISIASFDVDLAQILKGSIILRTITNIDNQSDLNPAVKGVVVRIYTKATNGTWTQIGQSVPIQQAFQIKKGRTQLQSKIEVSASSLGLSILGTKNIDFKVETTVLTNMSLPLVTEYTYNVNIDAIKRQSSTALTSIKDLFKKPLPTSLSAL